MRRHGAGSAHETQHEPETAVLLQQLLENAPPPTRVRRAPVALRSTGEQRRYALAGYRFRTWIDSWLGYAERLLALAALVLFGYWLYDGPIHDWLYRPPAGIAHATNARVAPGTPTVVPTVAIVPDQAPARAELEAAPLPVVTQSEASVDEDFIAPRAAPVPPSQQGSSEPSRLEIPALGLDTPIHEVFVVDGEWQVAEYAAGYMHGTALPGEKGTTALAGHAGLRGAVFRDLPALQPGDDVWIDAGGWRYRYRVRELFSVWPTDTSVLAPSEASTLVLITCTNWDTQRLIVRADLIESKPETS